MDGPKVSLHFYHIYDFDGEAKNLIFEQILWVQLPDLGQLDFLEGDRSIIEKLLLDGEATLLRSMKLKPVLALAQSKLPWIASPQLTGNLRVRLSCSGLLEECLMPDNE